MKREYNVKFISRTFVAILILFVLLIAGRLQVHAQNTSGWILDNTGWWYQYSDGSYPALSWRKIDGQWWYFDSRGYWVDNNEKEKGTIKGIDVSSWQGTIDWKAVKEDGVEFAFIRVGRTDIGLDSKFVYNIQQANAVGIPVGVYFYCKAQTPEQAVLEAQFVIQNIVGHVISYPVVIDLEDSSQDNLSKEQIGAIGKAFCDEIRSAGYTPMLYANEWWCRSRIDMSQLQNVEKWIARYSYTYSDDIERDIWQCCSTGRIKGIEGNVDIDFGYTDYTKSITPRTQPVEWYAMTNGKWVKDEKGWWYHYYAGGYPANQWKNIASVWYWFDENGYMATGWKNIRGKWYYLNNNGAMVTGWQKIDGEWYFFDISGAMLSNRWLGDYYLKANGAMATNEWIGYYYVGVDGVYQTGWLQLDGVWYYLGVYGAKQTGWRRLNNIWYYFESDGAMVTGWKAVGGKWYYLKSNGAMATGW